MNILWVVKKSAAVVMIILALFISVSCVASENQSEQFLDRDKDIEFISESGIRIESLSEVQIKNLQTLGKVWGFVKYRHPNITRGDINWDSELFRIMPKILGAKDMEESNRLMSAWLNQFPFEVKPLSEKQLRLSKTAAVNFRDITPYE